MQNFHLHKKLYQLSKIDETNYSTIVWARKEKLEHFSLLTAQGCDEKTVLTVLSISRATYYRWKKRYKGQGLIGLENKSKRPNKLRGHTWGQEEEQFVLTLRKQYPLWGKCKIAFVLQRDFGKSLSVSMVGRILHDLLTRKLIQHKCFLYGRLRDKKPRIFTNHAQRWKYGMKAQKPGELLQIDHASIELADGKIVKHFQAICPVTKWSITRVYHCATSNIAKEFFAEIRRNLPFKLHSVQVDGGSEFMGEFEEECKISGTPLYVLPPKSPKLNGHVERGNCTAKYEFYYQYQGRSLLEEIGKELSKFEHFYNTFRPHQTLHYKTPLQYCHEIGAS
jgi:transposase